MEKGKEMKILPAKKYLIPRPGKGVEYREICCGFEPGKEFENAKELEARCLFCKNGVSHGGYDCVDGRSGYVCLAGCDPRENGEYKANLRENKKEEGGNTE